MDRSQILRVLIFAAGAGGLLLIVGLVLAISNGTLTPTSSAPAPITPPPPPDGSVDPRLYSTSNVGDFGFPLDGPEWKELSNGVKYWDVKEGEGDPCPDLTAKPNLVPSMHYTGWLTNGTQFDSSKGKAPLGMPLNQLIVGWKIGVPGMKKKGIRRLLIPSEVGYGARGSPPGIPPYANLVFEMELVAFN